MTAEILKVVALVLSLQGDLSVCDKGLVHGVRVGDRGTAFYTLGVDGRQVPVVVGQVEVFEAGDSSSRVRAGAGVDLRPGYSIELEVDAGRTSAAEYLKLAETRFAAGELDSALRFYRKLNELLPGDVLVSRRIREIEAGIEDAGWLEQEKGKLDYYRTAAGRSLEEGDLEAARSYVERVLRVEAGDEATLELQRHIEASGLRARMLLVQSGEYWVGRDRTSARFYNEQPRHSTMLKEFWCDQAPVTSGEFERRTGERPTVAGPIAVGITYEQASRFCETLGKRLPSEFEWEVAAGVQGFEHASRVAEWTASWYEPYPGNAHKEKEYGKNFRVIRGLDSDGRFDPFARSFLGPGERSFDVGFRCVLSP